MHEGDAVVLFGLTKTAHLNGKRGVIVRPSKDDRWIVRINDGFGPEEEVIVAQANLLLSSQREPTKKTDLNATKLKSLFEKCKAIGAPCDVVLRGLGREPARYKDHYWPDPSSLNSRGGHIVRREGGFFIVVLENSGEVKKTSAGPITPDEMKSDCFSAHLTVPNTRHFR